MIRRRALSQTPRHHDADKQASREPRGERTPPHHTVWINLSEMNWNTKFEVGLPPLRTEFSKSCGTPAHGKRNRTSVRRTLIPRTSVRRTLVRKPLSVYNLVDNHAHLWVTVPSLYTPLWITPFFALLIPTPVDNSVYKYPDYPVDNPYLSPCLLINLLITSLILSHTVIDTDKRKVIHSLIHK